MTRAHVRLLGPCFKTGRIGGRLIGHGPRVPARELHPTSRHRGRRAPYRRSSPVEVAPRRGPPAPRGRARRVPRFLGPTAGRRHLMAVTLTPRGQLPSGQGLVTARRTGRGSRRGGKCTRRRRPRTGQGPWSGIPKPGAPPSGELNSAGRLLRAHSFASKWFHVLLNSLFKVLFNFPSRYLFAIGLVQVFSLRWSLPPALGCIPKQPDSEDAQRAAAARHQRPDTRHG